MTPPGGRGHISTRRVLAVGSGLFGLTRGSSYMMKLTSGMCFLFYRLAPTSRTSQASSFILPVTPRCRAAWVAQCLTCLGPALRNGNEAEDFRDGLSSHHAGEPSGERVI